MSRFAGVLATVLAILATLTATAAAHQGDPRYRSVLKGVDPGASGLQVQVLNYDDRFELDNRTGKTVMVYGYNDEPYARIAPDGTVALNRNSTAYYLNDERYANVTVPAEVSRHPKAAPAWVVQDRTGRFEWHDHRMHYMVRGVAPQVRDQARRTKIFDYAVPIAVGADRASITGTLWWVGRQDSGSFPIGAIVALAAIVLLLGAAVVLVRRRRGSDGAGGRGDRGGAGGASAGGGTAGGGSSGGAADGAAVAAGGSSREAW
jgi:hypothetical protein